ncbi:hypothetical protein V6N13_040612 [Hibiscus sabdariffa]
MVDTKEASANSWYFCSFVFVFCNFGIDITSFRSEVDEDCSIITTECIEPKEESTGSAESIESEITSSNKASVSSYSEPQNGLAQIVQWRGFFRILKEGTGISSQSALTPVKPKLARKNSKRFRGELKSGILVATKRLNRGSSEEMTVDFLSELGVIAHVDHRNIAKLIGYGVEGGMHMVLQLSPNGSLASILYGPKEKLNWEIRFKIALGAAEGFCYLHEGCQRRIIHKDIKASNILLSEDFDAQSSCHDSYLPPEFVMHGVVDEKTDAYAFGVLLLELINGRQAIDSSQQSIVMWAKPLIREDKMKKLVDPILDDAYDSERLQQRTRSCVAFRVRTWRRTQGPRPVVDILKGNDRGMEIRKQREETLQRTYSEEIFDAEEYNSTKYLSDMNHQMEILLEQSNYG